MMSYFSFVFFGISFEFSHFTSIMFSTLFFFIFSFAYVQASGFISLEIILIFFFLSCFSFLARTIGYGATPANAISILKLFFVSLPTSSAIIFRSFDNLGEKYVLLMSKVKVQLFSL